MKRFMLLLFFVLLSGCAQPVAPGPGIEGSTLSSNQDKSADFVTGEVIVRFRDDSSLHSQNLDINELQIEYVRTLSSEGAPKLYRTAPASASETLRLVDALAARPDVLYAHPNFLLTGAVTPNDPLYAKQWHYPAINLPAAWDQTKGSSGVRIAVIDSGVLRSHPDLSAKLVAGYDFVSNVSDSGDGNGRDNNPEDPGGNYHGSHVAGTIGATTNNGSGAAGVSWESRILPVRALGLYGGSLSDVIDGMLWSAGRSVAGAPSNANPAQILNLSLGGVFACSEAPAFQDAINQVNAAGAIIVVAAGNNADDARYYSPASCSGVITVGATNLFNQRAWYSNFGPRIDVMAPGGDVAMDANGDGQPDGVLSTVRTEGGAYSYAYYDGTSMAAPHVAGVVALMKSSKPSLTRTQVLDILKRTARPISHSSCGVGCGAGLVDAAAAVRGIVSPSTYDYTLNFSNLTAGRVITSVAKGRGITSNGPVTNSVSVLGLRKGKAGNVAMIQGTAKLLILSTNGTSQTPNQNGGTLTLGFQNFGTKKVTVKSLKVNSTTSTGGTVKVYNGTALRKSVTIPKLSNGTSRVLTLNITSADRVVITLTGAGKVDDLVVNQ